MFSLSFCRRCYYFFNDDAAEDSSLWTPMCILLTISLLLLCFNPANHWLQHTVRMFRSYLVTWCRACGQCSQSLHAGRRGDQAQVWTTSQWLLRRRRLRSTLQAAWVRSSPETCLQRFAALSPQVGLRRFQAYLNSYYKTWARKQPVRRWLCDCRLSPLVNQSKHICIAPYQLEMTMGMGFPMGMGMAITPMGINSHRRIQR